MSVQVQAHVNSLCVTITARIARGAGQAAARANEPAQGAATRPFSSDADASVEVSVNAPISCDSQEPEAVTSPVPVLTAVALHHGCVPVPQQMMLMCLKFIANAMPVP